MLYAIYRNTISFSKTGRCQPVPTMSVGILRQHKELVSKQVYWAIQKGIYFSPSRRDAKIELYSVLIMRILRLCLLASLRETRYTDSYWAALTKEG